jgi:hypothetical protein
MAAVKADEAQVQAEPDNTLIVNNDGKVIYGHEHLQRIKDTGVAEKLKVIFGWSQEPGGNKAPKQHETAEEAPLFEGFPYVTPRMARKLLKLKQT